MRVLLGECVNRRLKSRLPGFEVYTVADMKWRGLKNDNLMAAAIGAGFDVFLTVDKNLEYQQNLKNYDIIVAVFDVRKNTIEQLELFVPAFQMQLPTFIKGQAYRIKTLNA